MIPNILSITRQYSLQVNPGMEIINTYYYDIGLCHRMTRRRCYSWRTTCADICIFRVRDGKYKTTLKYVPKNYM